MKRDVTQYDFEQAFRDYGRNDQFTYEALRALYDYLIELEESCDTEIELDVIALCCEYSEHNTALEAAREYGFKPDNDETFADHEESAVNWLNERTQVIVFNGGVIIQGF